MSQGMKFVLPGNTVTDTRDADIAYQSTDERLQVLAAQQPPHFGVLDYSFSGPVTLPASNTHGQTTLGNIQHSLGYVPASAVYVYINSAVPIGIIPPQSYYQAPVQLNTGAAAEYTVGYFCDSNQMQIYLDTFNSSLNPGPYADLTGVQLILKYYIFSNPGA